MLGGTKALLAPFLENEPGGHRWQRIPPTEKKGRVQTSSVTVSVVEIPESREKAALPSSTLRDQDIEVRTQRGSGPGGQHRNKTDSCVFVVHTPTGITAQATGKCQHQNRRVARELLEVRVAKAEAEARDRQKAAALKAQRGSGMRGDKIRTYRERDDLIITATGRKVSLAQVRAGKLNLLW